MKLNLAKKRRFTIMEGITLYKTLASKKASEVSSTFWQKIAEQNLLPERSWESLKKFWVSHEKKSIEHFLCDAIHHKYDFCLSFAEIPNKNALETMLREKYEEYFLQLEQGDNEESDD